MCECIGVNVLLYHFAINANVCAICTYTVNRVNLNLLYGQEVWSEPSMGARMVPANGKTTKTKQIFYMSFWLESISILLQIYTFTCNFCSRKGGALLLGHNLYGTYRSAVNSWPSALCSVPGVLHSRSEVNSWPGASALCPVSYTVGLRLTHDPAPVLCARCLTQ